MFTGLVQRMGRLEGLTRAQGGWSARIAYSPWENALQIGESVAVQGACLTVTEVDPRIMMVDVLDETLRKTAMRNLRPGAAVNLERALTVGDHLGGHWMSGHVDECGEILRILPVGRDVVWRVACSPVLARQTVMKGSIALDGVSLTVSKLGEDWFEVNLIPHTLAATSLHERRPGDRVNLEGDLIGKYVARLLGKDGPRGVTQQLLAENGFLGSIDLPAK